MSRENLWYEYSPIRYVGGGLASYTDITINIFTSSIDEKPVIENLLDESCTFDDGIEPTLEMNNFVISPDYENGQASDAYTYIQVHSLNEDPSALPTINIDGMVFSSVEVHNSYAVNLQGSLESDMMLNNITFEYSNLTQQAMHIDNANLATLSDLQVID